MTAPAARRLRIVVGVTGGIAAYKAVSVIRAFVLDGHHVDVVATAGALEFIGRPTLEAISRNPVHTELYDGVAEVRHVALGQSADVIVVAPTTANTLAGIAAGLAPDLLGNTILARRCPLVLAPAMHTEMWLNPATQANIDLLTSRGIVIIGPASGALTGTDSGAGRMSEPEEIVAAAYRASGWLDARVTEKDTLILGVKDLLGKRVLITGGGTREPIDPVRFIGNRSTGRQSVALATAALERGADVTFIGANLEVQVPVGARFIAVSSSAELQGALEREAESHDIVIMAAAIADYRPAIVSDSKLKKNALGERSTLELVQNPDLLAALAANARPDQFIIGFAAETSDDKESLLALGREKLARKGCDALVVNGVGWDTGFGTEVNDVIILARGGDILVEVSGEKRAIAERILDITR
ncbi:bifunctional phosphopantothenoylcysteine decarboxylase/phosphopantothenate--cysteine ligase CoaBC [Alpinimonas psychrophila]|uniref:Coenzyme A biosynthesis bifunctional protein CoaBC n=1 Tax=Alpinimonas psychrophila TaxID=748908 RepID=A0A7W3PNJ1_9MICO|nr:bifunctional phosphopantothenoylcysteine decarboxylase/phosphopantothenate--cysteine ligase CoaBC [Alpinimonas psychrophila]MBA8828512.1 phosphopantothenoylcysteine decarboxylase/phosphopantothenate--cysteine ligase [Alpinimonas psychrophila]